MFTDAIKDDPYIVKEDVSSYCPKCKEMSYGKNWCEPYNIKLYKRNIGDIILGPSPMVVTRKFKDVYEQNCLSGIKEFCRIQSVKRRGIKHNVELYYVKLNRYEVPIDYEQSKMKGDDVGWRCELCNPNGELIRYINGIYFKEEFPADIFHIYAFGGGVFLSERFIKVMESNGITNLTNNYELCDIYIRPKWPKEDYEIAKSL